MFGNSSQFDSVVAAFSGGGFVPSQSTQGPDASLSSAKVYKQITIHISAYIHLFFYLFIYIIVLIFFLKFLVESRPDASASTNNEADKPSSSIEQR